MNNDITRCAGSYQHQHGEFGRVIHQECIGCQRRSGGDPERQSYTAPPQFESTCPLKIGESK